MSIKQGITRFRFTKKVESSEKSPLSKTYRARIQAVLYEQENGDDIPK